MSSSHPLNEAGPFGLSYPMSTRLTVLPFATAPMRDALWFHWLAYSVLESPCPCGLSRTNCWSCAVSWLRYVPSSNARSTAAYVLGYRWSPVVNSGKMRYDSSVVVVTFTSTSKSLLYEKPRPCATTLPEYCNDLTPVNPTPVIAVGDIAGPPVTKLRISVSGGWRSVPADSCGSAS